MKGLQTTARNAIEIQTITQTTTAAAAAANMKWVTWV